MNSITIGRDPGCDLVVDQPGVAAQHAQLALDADGHAWLSACDPAHPVLLGRQQAWLRVEKTTLCVGDELRIGNAALGLEALCRPFGDRVVLRPAPHSRGQAGLQRDGGPGTAKPLSRPVRNPRTGILEEHRN
jgi:hypothetical protein